MSVAAVRNSVSISSAIDRSRYNDVFSIFLSLSIEMRWKIKIALLINEKLEYKLELPIVQLIVMNLEVKSDTLHVVHERHPYTSGGCRPWTLVYTGYTVNVAHELK